MSSERLETARKMANGKYLAAREYSLYRERFMDNTASLRAIKPAVTELQTAEKLLGKKEYGDAEGHIATALKQMPNDYAGLMLMSKCMVAQERYSDAQPYAEQARKSYPSEAQAMQLDGLLSLKTKKYAEAFNNFDAYEKALPGNPYTAFYKGYSQEGMGHTREAAQEYVRFLKQVNEGDQAKYAYYKLVEWGYVKGTATPVANPLTGLA
jgi:thioredoxin-like negative regulator of GroEL